MLSNTHTHTHTHTNTNTYTRALKKTVARIREENELRLSFVMIYRAVLDPRTLSNDSHI